MSKRPPNELESRLHQAALAAPKKEITAKQAEAVIPDATARQNALNFLLGVGLLKGLTSASGQLSFRAVSKDEIVATKGLTGEENLVLGHIKSSANEGIWTKHLKAKTSLHQTVIDRCLKTLTQKRLIKRVPSVQHITRKIYMLEGLEPSIALTGGPWYTDNELDTEFIQNLTEACYRLISDISFPKRRAGAEHALYPISNAPQYPTADSVRHALRRAKLTETDLTVEHVEMLLNILVLDGKVEKIPSFGSALWDVDAIPDGADESSDEDRKEKRKKKRKQRAHDEESDDDAVAQARKKRRKRAVSESESDSDDAAARRKAKKKRAKDATDSEDDASDSEPTKSKHRKRKKDVSSSEEEDSDAARRRRKSKKKRRDASPDEDSGSSDEEESRSRRKKSKARSRSKAMKRSSSPAMELEFDTSGGGSVYRALKAADTAFSWSEAPCELCPSFEFCKEGGPVNARECVYYGDWLSGESIVKEEES